MKIYQTKSLIPGYKLGKPGKEYVSIPQNKSEQGYYIAYGNKLMKATGNPEFQNKFPDKYGRGFYYLHYYEWKPLEIKVTEM
jgi:hypothetical protein